MTRLDDITARLDATRARLEWQLPGKGLRLPATDPNQDDADLNAYESALRAVLDLHREIPIYLYADECGHEEDEHHVIESDRYGYLCADSPTGDHQCETCCDEDGDAVTMPCLTRQLITRHQHHGARGGAGGGGDGGAVVSVGQALVPRPDRRDPGPGLDPSPARTPGESRTARLPVPVLPRLAPDQPTTPGKEVRPDG